MLSSGINFILYFNFHTNFYFLSKIKYYLNEKQRKLFLYMLGNNDSAC